MTHTRHSVCAVAVAVGLLLSTPGLGAAQPAPASPDDIATLIAAVADANQKLQNIGADMQSRQESVNKAIVDLQAAREQVDTAKAEVAASQRAVDDASAAISAAQQRFDTFAAASYLNGPSSTYVSATSPEDVIATVSAGETLAISAKQTLADLQRARTEQVNRESAARAAEQKADQAAADAQRSQDDAVAALTDAQRQFGDQKTAVDRLAVERDAAKARLDSARATWSAPAATGQAPAAGQAATDGAGAHPGGSLERSRGGSGSAAKQYQQLGHLAVGPDAARGTERIRERRPDRDHQLGSGHFGDLVAGNREHGPTVPHLHRHPFADRQRDHQRTHPTGVRATGVRIRDPPSHVADGRAVLVGRRHRGGTQPRDRRRRRHRGVRLLRADPVRFRRRRHQAAALLGLAIQHGPQDPVVADAARRRHLLRARRQPARDPLPRRRPNARGSADRGAGQGLAGSDQRNDAVCRALHRVLNRW